MLYGIGSDVHGNDVALEEVVHDMQQHGIRTGNMVFLGDIVGYNAHPERTARLVAESGAMAVSGNHCMRSALEKGAAFPTERHIAAVGELGRWSRIADECIEYTVGTISDESARYLANLPLTSRFDHSVATHAGLLGGWPYFNINGAGFENLVHWNMMEMMKMRQQPGNSGPNICFVGHSHVPGFIKDPAFGTIPFFNYAPEGAELDVSDRSKMFIVDAGSVGQPRDGNPKSSWLKYDSEKGRIAFMRTEYDVDKITFANMEAGLPAEVSSRLYRGH